MIATGFTGNHLDRADRLRHDPQALAEVMSDWRAKLLLLDGADPRFDGDGALSWGSLAEAPDDADLALLGLEDGKGRFIAVPRAGGDDGGMAMRMPTLLMALHTLPAGDAALYASARSLLLWHRRHPFCAVCGHATQLFRAGWGRHCPNCKAEHFPRTDPVVIMIAEHEGRALLGRQPSWPAGRYSALAGFLEPGESIEEAVVREISEEAGIHVRDVRYVASQPWPFPSQLMMACIATADSDELTIDTNELQDAIWVPRDVVRHVLAGGKGPFLPPPPYAIAHTLLSEWAALD